MTTGPRISAVVPALDEEATIGPCLERLRSAGAHEVLVVDGGSRDGTLAVARATADRVLVCRGGLFAQLNRGAELAAGDALLFQYADGMLSPGGIRAAARFLAEAGTVGGAFCLRFASARPTYRAIALGASVRNRLGFGPFGDQSIFVRRDVFCELGGFDTGSPLADYELVRDLRRRGRFRILGACVTSSVRRWERQGLVRTLLEHWRVSASYLLARGCGRPRRRQAVERLRRVR